MTKRLLQRHKSRRRIPQRKNKKEASAPTGSTNKRANVGLGLTILGVLLGLISLWPSLTVSVNTPTDPAQPFSVPFQITNASYIPLKDVKIYCYIHRVRIGGLTVKSSLLYNNNWRAAELGRGESITIISKVIYAPILPAEADIVIVADYKVWGLPFIL